MPENKKHEMKNSKIKKYTIEFLSIFIAVISAFALNNWNDNRKNSNAESKILTEIANGLKKDKEDAALNMSGHKNGLKSCAFWLKIFKNQKTNLDTLTYYYRMLTRDFISIQNTSGYETLKSRGFELIKNDTLRAQIISLYEFDYQMLKKLEEDYSEMQFHQNYHKDLNRVIAPHFKFDPDGDIIGIEVPMKINEADRKVMLTYLFKIRSNRLYILTEYERVIQMIDKLINNINAELNG
jgi:hypothetical protein